VVELFVMKKDSGTDLNAFIGALIKRYRVESLSDDARRPVQADCGYPQCHKRGSYLCPTCLQATYCSKDCEQSERGRHAPTCTRSIHASLVVHKAGSPPSIHDSPEKERPLVDSPNNAPIPESDSDPDEPSFAPEEDHSGRIHRIAWQMPGEAAPPLLSGLISGDVCVSDQDLYSLDDYQLELGDETETTEHLMGDQITFSPLENEFADTRPVLFEKNVM